MDAQQSGQSSSTNSLTEGFKNLATMSHSETALTSGRSDQTVVGATFNPSDTALFKEFFEYKEQREKEKLLGKKRTREESGTNTGSQPKKGRPNIPAEFQTGYRNTRNSTANQAKFTVLELYLKKYLDFEDHLVPRSMQVRIYLIKLLFNVIPRNLWFIDDALMATPYSGES